jgi:hypothetical protein
MEKNTPMNEEVFNRQFEEATKRGQESFADSPKAANASYNRKTKRLTIELENGVAVMIPGDRVQIFEGATDDQIQDVDVVGGGLYLRWHSLDEDMFVPNLLNGILGTQKWMNGLKEHLSNAGRKGGAARTLAKRAASAANGKKGGRPKKIVAG